MRINEVSVTADENRLESVNKNVVILSVALSLNLHFSNYSKEIKEC